IDDKLLDLSLRNARDRLAFRGGHVLRPDHEIAIPVERWVLTGFQHRERRRTRGIERAHRRWGKGTRIGGDGEQEDRQRLEHETPSSLLSIGKCSPGYLGERWGAILFSRFCIDRYGIALQHRKELRSTSWVFVSGKSRQLLLFSSSLRGLFA